MNNVTQILRQIEHGDSGARDRLLSQVYEELRRLAAARMAAERPGQTLQATALVHEAWLRLAEVGPEQPWQSRAHFFAAAATAMRRILVDSARRKRRPKHGGDQIRIGLEGIDLAVPEVREDLVALDAALVRLAQEDPQSARLVELRHFAGLSIDESAQILGISPRSTDRLWGFARAWLHRELIAGEHADDS